jgi:hypothetical protein
VQNPGANREDRRAQFIYLPTQVAGPIGCRMGASVAFDPASKLGEGPRDGYLLSLAFMPRSITYDLTSLTNLRQQPSMPPLVMQFLMAMSRAISNVRPRPWPSTPVIGQYEVTCFCGPAWAKLPNESRNATRTIRFITVSPYQKPPIKSTAYTLMHAGVGQVRRRLNRILLLTAALIPLGSAAAEVPDVMRVQSDGVTLDIKSLVDRVVFCITAKENIKISAQYGVTFDADRLNAVGWDESLPKTITGPDWDFSLPLRVDLKTRSPSAERRIRIRLGACSDHCDLVQLDLRIPSHRGEVVSNVTCGK